MADIPSSNPLTDDEIRNDVVPISFPNLGPTRPLISREKEGFFASAGIAADDLYNQSVQMASGALDSINFHGLDNQALHAQSRQEVHEDEDKNMWGEAAGLIAPYLVAQRIPGAGRVVGSAVSRVIGGSVRRNILGNVEKESLIEEELGRPTTVVTPEDSATISHATKYINGARTVAGLLKTPVSITGPAAYLGVGDSVFTTPDGITHLDTKEAMENSALNIGLGFGLYGTLKGLQLSFAKGSPFDLAHKTQSKKFIEPQASQVTAEQTNAEKLLDADKKAPILSREEEFEPLTEEEQINKVTREGFTPEQIKSMEHYVEDDTSRGVVGGSIKPHPDIADALNDARIAGANEGRSFSKPAKDYMNALYSRSGVILNGTPQSLDNINSISQFKDLYLKARAYDNQRGARKVFYTNKFYEELKKQSPSTIEKFNELDQKYFKGMAMQNTGAIMAKSSFRLDRNTGVRTVDHPVWWLEPKGVDFDNADSDYLESKANSGNKAAKYMQAIVNQGAQSGILNGHINMLKEMDNAITNFKSPSQVSDIFDSARDGFQDYGVSASQDDFKNVMKDFESHIGESKDAQSVYYNKIIVGMKKPEFEDYIINCILGA